ncbi:hypothetical protein [Rickettsia conorii]|uniref:hypothetical protein n=1 Tax=Rickettsia conorii TaxID=781 RepID=UPI002B41770C|nr:hypothetical protein [Rickettsia conorii]
MHISKKFDNFQLKRAIIMIILFPKLTIVSATSTFGSDNNFTVFMFAKFIGNLN